MDTFASANFITTNNYLGYYMPGIIVFQQFRLCIWLV